MSGTLNSSLTHKGGHQSLEEVQSHTRKCLKDAIERSSEQTLEALFSAINDYAFLWQSTQRKKNMAPEMSRLFSAASALISHVLNRSEDPASLLARLVRVLDVSQRERGSYSTWHLEDLPEKRLHITATGGEEVYRTLYVTIATGLICSNFMTTVVQGNYSVTGCECGAFAESDMMQSMGYPIGYSEVDLLSLKEHRFAYLHVQHYHPILNAFSSERGSLGFRDMMKLTVALADPFRCSHQFIGVWNTKFMEPMAKALFSRGCVRSGALVASETVDEFTTDAHALLPEGNLQKVVAQDSDDILRFARSSSADRVGALQSEDERGKECEALISMFDKAFRRDSPKLQFVLHNAALALAVAYANGPVLNWQAVADWKLRLADEWSSISEHVNHAIEKWKTLYHRAKSKESPHASN